MNNRKIFIVNPRFQLRFSFMICSLIFIASLIYPLTIYDLIETLMIQNPDNAEVFASQRVSLLIILIIVQVGFLGFIFVLSIRMTHKVAGPIYKLTNFLTELREGKEYYPLKFRDGDQFPELAIEINETVEYFLQRDVQEQDDIKKIIEYIDNISIALPEDKKPVTEEIKAKLLKMKHADNS